MKLQVQTQPNSVQYELLVEPQSTVKQLKEQLSEVLGKSPQELKIIYRNQLMQSSMRQLNQYGVKDGAKLIVFISDAPKPMRQVREERADSRRKDEDLEKTQKQEQTQEFVNADAVNLSESQGRHGHEAQVLVNIWDKLEITPEILKEKIESSPVLQYLSSINGAFSDFIQSEQVLIYLHRLLTNKEVVRKLIKSKTVAKNCLSLRVQDQFTQAPEVSTEYEGEELQRLQMFKSEIENEHEKDFEYQNELNMLLEIGIDVDTSIIRQLLLFFDGDIDQVLEELYKLD